MKYPFIILMNSHLIPKMINNEGLPSGSPFYLRYSRKPHPTLVRWGLMRSHFTVLLISDGQISDCVVFWSPVSGYIFPGFQYQPLQSLPKNNYHSRKVVP